MSFFCWKSGVYRIAIDFWRIEQNISEISEFIYLAFSEMTSDGDLSGFKDKTWPRHVTTVQHATRHHHNTLAIYALRRMNERAVSK